MPQQRDCYNCGVFCLMFGEHAIQHVDTFKTIGKEDIASSKCLPLARFITSDTFDSRRPRDMRNELLTLMDKHQEQFQKTKH